MNHALAAAITFTLTCSCLYWYIERLGCTLFAQLSLMRGINRVQQHLVHKALQPPGGIIKNAVAPLSSLFSLDGEDGFSPAVAFEHAGP